MRRSVHFARFEAFICSFSPGRSKMKVCVTFSPSWSQDKLHRPIFSCLKQKFRSGQWSEHRWWMAAPTERQQPRLRGSRGGGDAGSLTQRGGPVENTPDWTLRIGPLCGGPSDWLPCPPRGSDLSSELIMEPNSCCCHPINRNHFYSILLVLFWPLLSARLSTDCALCPPPPHIQTLRSCLKLLGPMIKPNRLNIYCSN